LIHRLRPITLRRLKTSLAFKLALLAVLLSVPIFSVAATQYGLAADQIELANRERRGVAFLCDGSRLLQAIADVRLTPRPTARTPAAAGIPAEDRRAVAGRLAAFARTASGLADFGVGPDLTARASAAWRRVVAAPGAARLEAAGAAVLKAQSFVADASRLSYEPHLIEANLGDALSTESGIILQRLSAASTTAEVGASPAGVSVRDRIAIATYVGSADAAALSLAVDRAAAAEAGGPPDARLYAAWDALERSRTALRGPLQLVVAGERRAAVAPRELAARKRSLTSASARLVDLLERRIITLFDARAAEARRMQLLVILGSLLAALLSGGMVGLIGRVVVRRDRRELLAAQQQSRTLGAELAQQRAEKALLLTQAQFSAIFERSNMGIALLDPSGNTIEGNARLAELLDGAQVVPPHDPAFAELVKGTTATYHCERSLERDGARRWLEMTVSVVSVPKPAAVTAIAMVRDITDRKAIDERMRYAAMHDELTSLANRSEFVACLERELAASASRSTVFAVLFIDLDDFKLVNDTLGHHAGDQVLLVTARRIAAASRDVDLVARFHGDEFAVLLRELSGELAGEAAAERIRSELITPMSIEGKLVVVSSSIGVVLGNGSHASAEQVLRDADAAMYRTKSLGRSNELRPRHAGRLTSVSSIAS